MRSCWRTACGHLVQQRHGQGAPLDDDLVARLPDFAARPLRRAGAARRCRSAGRRCGTRAGRSARRGRAPARRSTRRAPAANRSATATACGTAPSRRSGLRRARRNGASSRPAARRRSRCSPARCPTALIRSCDRMSCAVDVGRVRHVRAQGADDHVEQAAGPAVLAEHLGLLATSLRPGGAAGRRGLRGRPAGCARSPGTPRPGGR